MIDRGDEEATGAARLHRLVERRGHHFGQRSAVELAGQRIEARETLQLALAFLARVDAAHDAVRARRFAVGAGEPAPGVLDPRDRVTRLEAVLKLIGNAAAAVA